MTSNHNIISEKIKSGKNSPQISIVYVNLSKNTNVVVSQVVKWKKKDPSSEFDCEVRSSTENLQ
jgi:hypothetical protein